MVESNDAEEEQRVTIRVDPWGGITDGFLVGVALPTLTISFIRNESAFNVTALFAALVPAVFVGLALSWIAPLTIGGSGIAWWHPLPARRNLAWRDIVGVHVKRVIFSRWLVLNSPRGKRWIPLRSVRTQMFAQAIADFVPCDHVLQIAVRENGSPGTRAVRRGP